MKPEIIALIGTLLNGFVSYCIGFYYGRKSLKK